MPGTSRRSSTSASNSPPGTGTSSTWSGCSCSSASMSGATAPKAWPTARIELRAMCYKGRPQGRPFVLRSAKDQLMHGQNLPSVLQSAMRGLACKCPRCGEGKLYAGFLTLRPGCENCGLDYAFIDSGDGPAVFIIMIAGAIVVG